MQDSEDEFDPNELKLLPVLATDRNTVTKNNELKRQQKQLMKSSKRINDPKFAVGMRGNKKTKLNSSFYKNRGELQMDQLSPFRASTDSKSLLGFIDQR